MRRIATILVVSLALAACMGSAPPPACSPTATPSAQQTELCRQQAAWARWGVPLEVAVGAREDVLRAAGQAHAANLLTDAQLAKIVVAGDVAGTALKGALAALNAYLLNPAAKSPDLALAAGQAMLGDLLRLAITLGVHT